jgi:hypothetical protein
MDSIASGISPEKLACLQAELAAVRSEPANFPDSLKDAVCDIVDQLKANGKQPEEVIIEMRRLCLDAGISTNQYTSGQTNRGIPGLVDKIISTCIERYYA